MTDLYSELLIKKEQTGKDKAIKILMIAAIAITAAAGLLIPIAWILTLALGIAAYFILPKLDLEYEYWILIRLCPRLKENVPKALIWAKWILWHR